MSWKSHPEISRPWEVSGRGESQQVKVREVSTINVVIGIKWVWRERGIVNVAHSGRMLAADTARSGAKAKLEANTSSSR